MAHSLTHGGFVPYQVDRHGNIDSDKLATSAGARQARTAGKRWLAISWALRPCGVSIFEAQTHLAERGGQPYSYSYTRSAQYARSEYAMAGYGLLGRAETVADHVAAVRAAEGDDAAAYTRACVPDSLSDDDQLLVVYAWAHNGIAYGDGGACVDGLPASADDVASRRDALTAQPAKSSGKRQARSKRGSGRK